MTIELYNALVDGGGARVAYVFFIAGLPYAFCNRSEAVSILSSDTTNRRLMFGNAESFDSTYRADSIPIFPTLLTQNLSQKITHSESKGRLSGGDWSVEIVLEEPGVSWTHRNSDTGIYGYDGLSTIPDSQFDSGIGRARLSRHCIADDTYLYIKNDIGSRLKTRIDELEATKQLPLYIGTELLEVKGHLDNYEPQTERRDVRLTVVTRGILKTPVQHFFVDDKATSNILISDAPLGGAAGRPAYLYALPLNNDLDDTAGDPFLISQGRVRPRIDHNNDTLTVNCTSWWEQLDTRMKTPSPSECHLKRFYFQKPDVPTGVTISEWNHYKMMPHLLIYEPDADGDIAIDGVTPRIIWLCGSETAHAGTHYASFESEDEVLDALNSELEACADAGFGNTTANGSDGTTYHYGIAGMRMVLISDDADHIGAWVGGTLPWIMNLGLIQEDGMKVYTEEIPGNIQNFNNFTYVFGPNFSNTAWERIRHEYLRWIPVKGDPDYGLGNSILGKHVEEILRERLRLKKTAWLQDHKIVLSNFEKPWNLRAAYFYQYLWTENTAEIGDDEILIHWPWPTDNGNERAYLHPVDNPDDFDDVDEIQIGRPDGLQYHVGVAAGGIQDPTSGAPYFEIDGKWIFREDVGEGGEFAAETITKAPGMSRGDCLFWLPICGPDPWPITMSSTFAPRYFKGADHSLYKILRGIFGANDIECPTRLNITHIPGAIDDDDVVWSDETHSDHSAVIDWEQLNRLLKSITLDFVSSLTITPEDNLLKIFTESLRIYGIAPTWEPDATDKMFKMRFRTLESINASQAISLGHVIDTEMIARNTDIKTNYFSERIANKFEIQVNYNPVDKQYKSTFLFWDQMTDNMSGHVDSKITIKSKLHHVDPRVKETEEWDKFLFHYSSLTKYLGQPQPELHMTCALSAALTLGAGVPAVVTCPWVKNPFSGVLGLTEQPVLITSIGMDWAKARCSITARLGLKQSYGWAPSVLLAANTTTIEGGGGELSVVLTSSEDHVYSPDESHVPRDLFYLDCYRFLAGTYVAKSCSCSDYKVLASRTDDTSFSPWPFTVSDVDIDARTFTLTGSTASWDVTKEHVLRYAAWDDADLQTCQRNYVFGALCADDGSNPHCLVDDDSNVTDGREWK